jgi:integrase
MVLLAYVTGMRRSEIFNLEERDIDFHLKLIYLRGTKGGKSVSIRLSDVGEDIVKNQLEWKNERFPENPYIFPGRTGSLRKGGQLTLDMIAAAMTNKSAGFIKKEYAQFLPHTLTAISN